MLMVMNMDARKPWVEIQTLKKKSYLIFCLTEKHVVLTLFYSQPVIFLAKLHFSV